MADLTSKIIDGPGFYIARRIGEAAWKVVCVVRARSKGRAKFYVLKNGNWKLGDWPEVYEFHSKVSMPE